MATALYNFRDSFMRIPDFGLVKRLKAAVHFTAFSRAFSCWAFQLSFESSRTPRSFAFGLAFMCWIWVSPRVRWLRMRSVASLDLVADCVKLTRRVYSSPGA